MPVYIHAIPVYIDTNTGICLYTYMQPHESTWSMMGASIWIGQSRGQASLPIYVCIMYI